MGCDLRAWGASVCLTLALMLVAACGGGGGDGDGGGGGGGGGLGLSLPQTRIEASAVARHAAALDVIVRINGLTPGAVVFLGATGGDAIFGDADIVDRGDSSAALRGTFRTDLAAGQYTDSVTFALCREAACTTAQLAPPVTATIVLTVLPNIEVMPLIAVSRSGAQAAPTVRVPVSIPGPAGVVQVQTFGAIPEAQARMEGAELVITTVPLRAGVYESMLTLGSNTDARYNTSTTVRYTVLPPAGGELALSTQPSTLALVQPQGTRVSRRVQVQPSTWTPEPVSASFEPTIPPSPATTVTRLSDTEFDVSIDLAGAAEGTYLGNLVFTQGTYGGLALLPLRIDVSPPFTIDIPPDFTLLPTSGASDLVWRSAVRMTDGSTARWTATVDQPWIRVRRSTGLTGQDAVELEVNPDPRSRPPVFTFPVTEAQLTLSVDRLGTLPIRWTVPVDNRLPTITAAAPGALLSSTARVVVRGNALGPELIDRAGLSVVGATLRRASFASDPRFVGDINVMLLDLEGITPGTDVTLAIANPAFSSSALLPARAPDAVAAGRQDLPFDTYRPPLYSERLRAWYFASPGTVWKFAVGSLGWATQRDDNQPGIVDVDLSPDEMRLLAAAPQRVYVLDANTLSRAALVEQVPESSANQIDTRLQPRAKALVSALDGQVLMGLSLGAVARLDIDPLVPTTSYAFAGPAVSRTSPLPRNIVVSADRSRVVVQHRDGATPNVEYTVPPRAFQSSPALDLAYDADIVAISNDGARTLDAMGVVRSVLGNADLRGALPTTHVAVGFGLTPDGSHGLVHAVRRSGSGASEEALEPLLIVVDVRTLPAALPLKVVSSMPMTAPVGCRLPRGAVEPCDHVASVSVDPVARMALVLGPRGVEVVPLPGSVRVLAGAPRVRALQQPTQVRAVRRIGP
jgi:hypothetical protein